MHYRKLGKTGLSVSVLGMGSSPFRNSTTPAACADLLERAAELGITYYDTARSYVNGEESIAHLSPHTKERLVIATKTGARGGKYCLQDLQNSLNAMRRDRIDVWMTHMIQTEQDYELCTALGGFCDIAAAARQAGLVRATGASFHAPTHIILRAIQERVFDVVMFQFNLIGRETVFGSSIASYREVLLPAAQANDIGVVVMKVLAGGELRHGAPFLSFIADRGVQRDVVGGAIRYVTTQPDIATAVVGMSNIDEVVRNVSAVKGMNDEQLDTFLEWTKRVADIDQHQCTRCGQCLGICPEGIEIPKVFRLHDQLCHFGMDRVARYKYSVMDIDASVCTRCGKCQLVCPEAFDIVATLHAADAALAPAGRGARVALRYHGSKG